MRAAAVVTLLALSCASRPPCPAGRVCGGATWYSPEPSANDRLVVLRALDVGVPDEPAGMREAIPLRHGSAFVRFDVAAVPRGARVARAMLTLSAHPSWSPSPEAARLRVRPVADGWTSESVARGSLPATRDTAGVELTLPAGQRASLRVDVTEAVRAWVEGGASDEGLALECDDRGAAFSGAGELTASRRPRIEVELR